MTLEQVLEQINAIETKIIDAESLLIDLKGAVAIMVDTEEEAIRAQGEATEAMPGMAFMKSTL